MTMLWESAQQIGWVTLLMLLFWIIYAIAGMQVSPTDCASFVFLSIIQLFIYWVANGFVPRRD